MSEPTKPTPFRDIAGPAMRVREITAQPSSEFYVPKSDAELEKILANCDDPNLVAALVKEHLKARGVLDASHPYGELGTTLNPNIRATPRMVSEARNAATATPSEEMVRLCETETDPSVLQNRLSHQLHNEPIVEVRQQAPPPKPLNDPNDGCAWKCYPQGNDEIIVSGKTWEEAREKAAAVYRKYGMDLPE